MLEKEMESGAANLKKMASKKSSVSRVITDKDGKKKEILMSQEEKKMHDIADAKDEEW